MSFGASFDTGRVDMWPTYGREKTSNKDLEAAEVVTKQHEIGGCFCKTEWRTILPLAMQDQPLFPMVDFSISNIPLESVERKGKLQDVVNSILAFMPATQ